MNYTPDQISSLPFAIFAGGCFWCTEHDFETLNGVVDVISGYSGGDEVNPTYEQIGSHKTHHREAVKIIYDPKITNFTNLVRNLLTHIDPTDSTGQFYDRGESYEPVIFFGDSDEENIARGAIDQLNASKIFDKSVSVKVLPKKEFYPAEEYHQNFSQTHYDRYCSYRTASGKDEFLKKVWGERKWV